MPAVTAEKLGDTVGAQVVGVDRERLLDDASMPAWTLDALEEHGALVFRDLHLDDAMQVAFSRKLGTVETPGRGGGEFPEIFRVTLDPAKNPAADVPARHLRLAPRRRHRRHPDHGHAAQRPRRRCVRRRDRVRQHVRRLRRPHRRGAGAVPRPSRVVHSFEAAQRLTNPDPSPEELAMWRKRPAKTHPLVWQHQSGRRSLVLGATTSHVEGMDVDEGRALLDDLLARSTDPDRVYRHEWAVGDMVIWDNRGVLHRAFATTPTSAARHAPHDHRRRRADPMTAATVRASCRCRPTSGRMTSCGHRGAAPARGATGSSVAIEGRSEGSERARHASRSTRR